MTDQPSTSTGQGVDNVSETYPEIPTEQWFEQIRQRANQTTPTYHVQHTPNTSPESPRIFLGSRNSKPKRLYDETTPKKHSKKRRVQAQDPQPLDTQNQPTQTLDPSPQQSQSLQESMDVDPESLQKSIQHSRTRRVQAQDTQPLDTQNQPTQTLDPLPQQSLQETMDDDTEPLQEPMDVDTESVNMHPSPRGRALQRSPARVRTAAPDRKSYNIATRYRREIKAFSSQEEVYVIQFKRQYIGKRLTEMINVIYDMFDDLINMIKTGRKDSDKVRVYISHRELFKPVVVHLRPLHLLSSKVILDRLEHVLQSAEHLKLDDDLVIKVGVVEMPSGGGRNRCQITNLNKGSADNSLKKKRSVVELPYDEENLCCARSLVVCRAYRNKLPHNKWESLIRKQNHYSKKPGSQRTQARQLQEAAGLPIGKHVCISDLHKFEQVLDAQIIVLCAERGNAVVYSGQENEKKYFLYLEMEEKHYSPILKPAAFLGRNYYCETCLKPYEQKETHKCFDVCKVCKDLDCTREDPLTCRLCNRECRSIACFNRHKSTTDDEESICSKFKRCTKCLALVNLTKRPFSLHKCGEAYCRDCEEFFNGHHDCYVKVKYPRKTSGVFLFFDCESTMEDIMTCDENYSASPQDDCEDCTDIPCRQHSRCQNCERLDCGVPRHVVNYIVCQSQCDNCKDKPIEEPCGDCGTRCKRCDMFESKTERIFARDPCKDCGKRQTVFNTIEQFGEFIFKEYHCKATVISHNGGKYDEYFLLDYALKNSIIPSIVYAGSRIMCMHVKGRLNIKFLDSLSFLPMALRKLPKAFDLDTVKGEFPYFFNKKDNVNYRGAFPSPEMYGVDSMSTEDRSKFLDWHVQQKGIFHMQEQLHKYCEADVTILRQACTKFRDLMFQITIDEYFPGLDVFSCTTIASVCMTLFQAKFHSQEYIAHIKSTDGKKRVPVHEKGGRVCSVSGEVVNPEKIVKKTNIRSAIAKIPSGGYAQKHGYSKQAIQWLEWESLQRNIKILHACNAREEKLCQYKADGFNQNAAGETTVFEYNGCIWHGCRCIRDRDLRHPHNHKTMDQLFAMTAQKEKNLRESGHKVVSIWQCQWEKKVKQNSDIQNFISKLDIPERLNPRESFFGGRTCPFKLHYQAAPEEKIKYVDFTSLYPWVNKYCEYPVGHPEIITDPSIKAFNTYFGIAKIDILPPRKLLYGVLPLKIEDKLMFPLCRTCGENLSPEPCMCSDTQRTISGTWCTPEIQLALLKGYTLKRVYEVYHFAKTSKYNPDTKSDGLFAEYVNKFLKIKQEASGWPRDSMNDCEKEKYIIDYEKNEGVKLDAHKIAKNPGLRSIAKLCLNSFWGKFGQSDVQGKTEFVSEPARFFKLLSDCKNNVKDFRILSDQLIQVEFEEDLDLAPSSKFKNIFIASFTTTYARIKLYSLLDMLKEQVIYCDTDSIIYSVKSDEKEPCLGDYLGELTNELSEGDHIIDFVSSGPKAYSYLTFLGQTCSKLKGFSLNFTNAQKINFETMKNMVLCGGAIATLNPNKICRDKKRSVIYNVKEEKTYKLVYDKRVLQHDLTSLPYGYG